MIGKILVSCLLACMTLLPGIDASSAEQSGVFRMQVKDVFQISGRGLLVTGRIDAGSVSVGDEMVLVQKTGGEREVTVTGIESFGNKQPDEMATRGDDVGLLLDGISKKEISKGDPLQSRQ